MATEFQTLDAQDLESKPRRAAAKPKAPGPRTKPSLKIPIAGMLVMFNMPVTMFAPRDALDDAEIEALATAMDEQCQVSPRFRRYVESMIGVGRGGQLLMVAGMVAGRRAARHGILGESGEQADDLLGMQLSQRYNAPHRVPPYPARETQKQAASMPFSNGSNPVPEPPGGFTGSVGGLPPVGNPGADLGV